jgi:hypothetical protein
VAVATDKVLAAHPDLAKVWNAVRVKSLEYANTHAAAYYAWSAQQGNTTAAAAKQSAPLSSYPIANFSAAGIKQLQGTLDFLVAQKEAKPFSIHAWQLNANG